MALPEQHVVNTIDEYLELERASEERHEYLDGQIYQMAGESGAHADICTNLVGELHPQLRGKLCRVRSKDTKVLSGSMPRHRFMTKGLFSYPDVVVICGEPQYLDEHRDVVINPTVIVEVLSPSTEAFDRGEKFRRYRTYLESLTDYVLISQSMPLIEHYRRQPNNEWVLAAVGQLEERLSVASIGCTLRLTEVYDRVTFPAETPETPDGE